MVVEPVGMDFGELRHDATFVTRVTDLDRYLEEIHKHVREALEMDPTKMTKEDRVKHELYLAYATNQLYYVYLKINGTISNEHAIMNELSRIRQAMLREKQLEDRCLRPKINIPVAKRVVKHELWDHKDQQQNKKNKS